MPDIVYDSDGSRIFLIYGGTGEPGLRSFTPMQSLCIMLVDKTYSLTVSSACTRSLGYLDINDTL